VPPALVIARIRPDAPLRGFLENATPDPALSLPLGRLGIEPAHPLGGDGFVLALHGDILEWSGRFIEEPREPLGHQYLPAASARLQPRRRIYDVTDGREVAHGVLAADVSDERFAIVEAYAELEHRAVGAAVAESFEQPVRVLQHHGGHRAAVDVVRRPGPLGDPDGQIQRHNLVANEFVDYGFREEHLLGDGV